MKSLEYNGWQELAMNVLSSTYISEGPPPYVWFAVRSSLVQSARMVQHPPEYVHYDESTIEYCLDLPQAAKQVFVYNTEGMKVQVFSDEFSDSRLETLEENMFSADELSELRTLVEYSKPSSAKFVSFDLFQGREGASINFSDQLQDVQFSLIGRLVPIRFIDQYTTGLGDIYQIGANEWALSFERAGAVLAIDQLIVEPAVEYGKLEQFWTEEDVEDFMDYELDGHEVVNAFEEEVSFEGCERWKIS